MEGQSTNVSHQGRQQGAQFAFKFCLMLFTLILA